MVSLAILGTAAYLTAGTAATAIVASTWAVAALTVAAAAASTAAFAYIDQPYIMPALFGSESPKDANKAAGVSLPTATPGSPRYKVYGREAYVPGHFLWILNQKIVTQTSGGGSGKGATAVTSVSERFADVGVACCDGPILAVTAALSHKAVFYGQRSSAGGVFSDPRVEVAEEFGGFFLGRVPNYYYAGSSPATGEPDSWHPFVTTPGGTSAASIFIEGLYGEAPQNRFLSFRVQEGFGITEGLAHHFDAGDVIEVFRMGDNLHRFQSSTAYGGLREGIYVVWFVGLDEGGTSDVIKCLPMAGQRTHSSGTVRPYGEADAIIIRKVDESVCGFTPDFNVPRLKGFASTPQYRRGTTPRNSLDHTFLATPDGNSTTHALLKVEVHANGGGYYCDSNSNFSGLAVEIGPLKNWTFMGQSRLSIGNAYELQGFCNPDRQHSLNTLTAELVSVHEYDMDMGYLNIPHRSTNGVQSEGRRYWAWFRFLRTDLLNIMNELDIGDETVSNHGHKWQGRLDGWTALYPGNGQACPQYVDGRTYDTGTWHYRTINPPVTAGGVPGLVRGSQTDWTNFNAGTIGETPGPSGTITTLTGSAGLQTWPGNSECAAASPTAQSTAYGPDRAGGADANNKGGIGDVGFCILPPKSDIFTDPSGTRCSNVTPQGIELNVGGPEQDPLTNSGAIAYRGLAHVSFTDLNLHQFGNAIPSISFKVQESEERSVGDMITMMIEDAAPTGTVVPGFSSDIAAYGYAVSGGTAIKHAIQPLSVAYGFSMQLRAGQFHMLQESELPIVSVPSSKLNARAYDGSSGLNTGLALSYTDSDDLPQRVMVKYTAIGSGNEESRAAGNRAPGSPASGTKDTLEYDLKPLVLTAGFAKQRAQELLNKTRTESTTSSTILPPSRMDVMPGTVITTSSNNNIITKPADSGPAYFNHSILVGDVIPGSLSIPVRISVITGTYGGGDYLEVVHSATLIDDGLGVVVGLPEGITFSTQTLAYTGKGLWLSLVLAPEAGKTISFIDAASIAIHYTYDVTRSFRAMRATLSGYDFTVNTPLVTTTHQHTMPRYQTHTVGALPPTVGTVTGTGNLAPIEDASVTGPWPSIVPSFGLALSGTHHGGATIYESPDGLGEWEVLGQIYGSAKVGTLQAITEGTAFPPAEVGSMSSWTIASSSDSFVDYTQSLVIESMGLQEVVLGVRTKKEVLNGFHNFMIKEEVVGATSVIAGTEPDTIILSGLMRGLRGSHHASRAHATGVTVTYLPVGSGGGIAHFEDPQLKAGPGTIRYLKAVLPGGTVANTPISEIESRAMRSLPSSPIVNEASLKINNTPSHPDRHSITFKWGAPATGKVPIFQPQLLAPYAEIYEVYAYDPDDVLDADTTEVGLDAAIIEKAKASWYIEMGGADREIIYPGLTQVSDGFELGDKIAFQAYARSPIGRGPRSYPDHTEVYVIMAQVG